MTTTHAHTLTNGRLISDVLKQNAEGLQQLQTDETTAVLRQSLEEEGLHVLL